MELDELRMRVSYGRDDYVIPLKDLEVETQDDGSMLTTFKDKSYGMSVRAKRNLLDKVGIPVRYFDKCPTFLQKSQLDYWLSKQFGDRVYIRTSGNEIRGVFSEKYKRFDNKEIIDIAQKVFEDKFKIGYATVTEALMGVGFLFREYEKFSVGLFITNSEVSASAVNVEQYIETADGGIIGDSLLRIVHSEGMVEKFELGLHNMHLIGKMKWNEINDNMNSLLDRQVRNLKAMLYEHKLDNLVKVIMKDIGSDMSAKNVLSVLMGCRSVYTNGEAQIRYMRKLGNIVERMFHS